MKEVVVLAENRIGTLANIAEALGGVGINIEGISAYEQGGRAVFRIITSDSLSARKALAKTPGIKKVAISEVVVVRVQNRPGELGKLTRKMANRGIDLESVYITNRTEEYIEVAVRPIEDHLPKVKELLKAKG